MPGCHWWCCFSAIGFLPAAYDAILVSSGSCSPYVRLWLPVVPWSAADGSVNDHDGRHSSTAMRLSVCLCAVFFRSTPIRDRFVPAVCVDICRRTIEKCLKRNTLSNTVRDSTLSVVVSGLPRQLGIVWSNSFDVFLFGCVGCGGCFVFYLVPAGGEVLSGAVRMKDTTAEDATAFAHHSVWNFSHMQWGSHIQTIPFVLGFSYVCRALGRNFPVLAVRQKAYRLTYRREDRRTDKQAHGQTLGQTHTKDGDDISEIS